MWVHQTQGVTLNLYLSRYYLIIYIQLPIDNIKRLTIIFKF